MSPSDLSALVSRKAQILDKAAERILDEQADAVLNAWRAGASGKYYPGMNRSFYSTAYAADLTRTRVSKSGEYSVEIGHLGKVRGANGKLFDLVATVEHGREPRDIKDAALRGPKAKVSKDGSRYAVIPFRHGAGNAKQFPTNVSPKAKRLVGQYGELNEANFKPTSKNPFRAAQERTAVLGPQRTKWIIEPVKSRSPYAHTLQGASAYSQRYLGPGQYQWQRPMFAGLRKYGAKGHSQWMTFRTISTKSDPMSWIQPRIAPNRIFRSMMLSTMPGVSAVIAASLRALE